MTAISVVAKDRQKHDICSTFAYLMGLRRSIFENEHIDLDLETYTGLEKDRNARIVHLLCSARNNIIVNIGPITNKLKSGVFTMNINEFPSYEIDELSKEGISIINYGAKAPKNSRKGAPKTARLVIDCISAINNELPNRIESCRGLFPEWVNWQYIRNLFRMSSNENEINSAIKRFLDNRALYPYQTYINWEPEDCGNMLRDDFTFLAIVYRQAGDKFTDRSKVTDVGERTKELINNFIGSSKRTVIIVDCENADPYRFSAAFNGLPEAQRNKIATIVLCDDVNSSSAWEIMKKRMSIPVDHIMTERVLAHKSVVDATVVAKVNQEHWKNETDAFILVSSDSDYSAMIRMLPDARFLLMLEREKTSPAFKERLDANEHCNYCYTEDFYSGSSDEDLKTITLITELRAALEAYSFNIDTVLTEVYRKARVNLSADEEARFRTRYVSPMHLKTQEDGTVTIEVGRT